MSKSIQRQKRAKRVRSRVRGTALRPRLCVFRSSRHLYAQIIDDETGRTAAAFDGRKLKGAKNDSKTAKRIGLEIAKIAKEKKIKEVIFDRHGYKYHGKVKALADGAREGGLKL